MLRARLLASSALALLFAAAPAAAHEHRAVPGTNYVFVVGFEHEPAIVGAPNALSLRATKTMQDATDEPALGLDKILTVDVKKDGSQKTLELHRVKGAPGMYAADLVPTRPGTYTFVIHGTVGDRTIEETFESGEGRFSDVVALDDIGFPPVATKPVVAASAAKPQASAAPAAASEPAAADLARREESLARATARADAADEKAHRAFIAALGALAAAALSAGAASLVARRGVKRR